MACNRLSDAEQLTEAEHHASGAETAHDHLLSACPPRSGRDDALGGADGEVGRHADERGGDHRGGSVYEEEWDDWEDAPDCRGQCGRERADECVGKVTLA